jgi:Tfp pilus assembly protein PilN
MSMINLLPDDYLIRRQQSRANFLCLALFLVVMTGVIAAAFVSDQSLGRTREILARIDADYEQAAKLLAELQQLQQQKTAMEAKARTTDALQERVPRSYLLGVITNSLPEGASLLDMQLQLKQVPSKAPGAKGANPTLVEMEIRGLAGTDVDVAKFIATLAANPLIASVDLVYSQQKTVEQVQLREFQLRSELKSGVDVLDVARPEALAAEPAAARDGGGA